MHGDEAPSPWVQRWAHLLPAGARVLDVACGRGRHVRWLAARGCAVTAIDRDADALSGLQGVAELITADIEAGPWPCAGRTFDAVLVTNYLWRPLWPLLLDAVAPGGWLLYETFAHGHQTVGRPARPAFLLEAGELLRVCQGLRIVAYEDGFLPAPERFVQRVVAVREEAGASAPPRYPLSSPPAPPG
ncbi:class I SAM-dependent methyltransferase [Aquabacterium sp.]|uniref:class I SAM-dependent methyltransferase n=1 Tax=Aquabacterium sp. TaxID=1872578 RepID=UPI002C87CCCB|nr:class I SAM-dependent methyltransferase [Aquabacterium sp.]HSW03203.1 class I SAM-dependent methyltransferase [Aquabacterium sp.]